MRLLVLNTDDAMDLVEPDRLDETLESLKKNKVILDFMIREDLTSIWHADDKRIDARILYNSMTESSTVVKLRDSQRRPCSLKKGRKESGKKE